MGLSFQHTEAGGDVHAETRHVGRGDVAQAHFSRETTKGVAHFKYLFK